uniref:Rho-GAP domain-containing protein n=1 Tax=Meleagris gallopavo TaxID=9103 RepID=A0A803XLN7_MELGA
FTLECMTQEGLFRVNGSMKMVEQLRLQYERGEEVELVKDGDVYSAASLLKLFLRELPDGIITSALQSKLIQLYQVDASRSLPEKLQSAWVRIAGEMLFNVKQTDVMCVEEECADKRLRWKTAQRFHTVVLGSLPHFSCLQ